MARIEPSLRLWGLLALGAVILGAPQSVGQDIGNAGVCARCHVSSALEWGISWHSYVDESDRLPNCIGCHGPSEAHVVDEQNTWKPDRLERGDTIAPLCMECHERGCPETRETISCQTCHHVHGLVNPTLDATAIEQDSHELDARLEAYRAHLTEGDRLVQLQDWTASRTEYRAALQANPVSQRAHAALQMIERRLNPGLPGFAMVGAQFDAATGLPKEVLLEELGIPFVLVPGGSFDLGSEERDDTTPLHTINVAPFYLAKYELTQAQWTNLMGANPSLHQGEGYPEADRMPVEQVSWEDCQELLSTLNQRVPDQHFRLPTEAEWEYAARAGTTERLPATELLGFAWLRENSEPANPAPPVRTGRFLVGSGVIAKAQPVGTREPNGWGLHDMWGNVSEWCSSLFQPYPYNVADGRESAAAPGTRVVRGNNFTDPVASADVTIRHPERTNRRFRWNGVRLVCDVPGED